MSSSSSLRRYRFALVIHWITALLVAFSGLSLASCKAGQPPAEPMPVQAPASVPEFAFESEGKDLRDLAFKLGAIDQLPDGGQRFIATATHSGNPVEIEVNLRPEWTGFRMPDGPTMYRGIVVIRSLGPASDSLLNAMDAIYKTQLKPKQMAETTECSAVSLQGDPKRLRSEPLKLKLFFESDRQDRAAELFLNIDAAQSRVFLKEKDEMYRKNIILALTRKAEGKEKR